MSVFIILLVIFVVALIVVMANDPRVKNNITALNDNCYNEIPEPEPLFDEPEEPVLSDLAAIPEEVWPKLKYMGIIERVADAESTGVQHGLWELFTIFSDLRRYRDTRQLFTIFNGKMYAVQGTDWYIEYLLKIDIGNEPNEYLEEAIKKANSDYALGYLNDVVETTKDMPGIINHVKAHLAREIYVKDHNTLLERIKEMTDEDLAAEALLYLHDETGSEYVELIREAVDTRTRKLRVIAERLDSINGLKDRSKHISVLRDFK